MRAIGLPAAQPVASKPGSPSTNFRRARAAIGPPVSDSDQALARFENEGGRVADETARVSRCVPALELA